MTKYIKAGQFRVPAGYESIAAHATEAREFPYGSVYIRLATLWMRLSGTTVTVVGAENIPADGGALLASNHTNYVDMMWVGVPAVLSLYFDWFSSAMQAFIFCMLTMTYIANARGDA